MAIAILFIMVFCKINILNLIINMLCMQVILTFFVSLGYACVSVFIQLVVSVLHNCHTFLAVAFLIWYTEKTITCFLRVLNSSAYTYTVCLFIIGSFFGTASLYNIGTRWQVILHLQYTRNIPHPLALTWSRRFFFSWRFLKPDSLRFFTFSILQLTVDILNFLFVHVFVIHHQRMHDIVAPDQLRIAYPTAPSTMDLGQWFSKRAESPPWGRFWGARWRTKQWVIGGKTTQRRRKCSTTTTNRSLS